MTTKVCIKCNRELAISSFHWRSDSNKHRNDCKSCRSKASLKQYYDDHDKWKSQRAKASRKYYLKKLYNMSVEDYEKMLEQQNYKCAICGQHETQKRVLSVDHCHKTGKVRGALCAACNRGIGSLKESKEVLEAAINYLQHHKDKEE